MSYMAFRYFYPFCFHLADTYNYSKRNLKNKYLSINSSCDSTFTVFFLILHFKFYLGGSKKEAGRGQAREKDRERERNPTGSFPKHVQQTGWAGATSEARNQESK